MKFGVKQVPTKGLWDVHGIFRTEDRYANGVKMVISNELPNGIKFEGSNGWIFVTRGNFQATASDPVPDAQGVKALDASDIKIITTPIGPGEIHLPVSTDHHGNWSESIRSHKQPIAPVEVAHRSCSTCLVHHIVMKLKRPVHWDPAREKFTNDEEANKLLARPQRAPYLVQ